MYTLIERWVKHAALEVQEYVYLVRATIVGIFTRPRYKYDIVEQFDLIGVGSLTVVVLTGFFTGASFTGACFTAACFAGAAAFTGADLAACLCPVRQASKAI